MKLLRFLFIALLFSCSGEDDAPVPEVAEKPLKANLEYPHLNSRCTEGSTGVEGKTEITFQWESGENTSSQVLVIKNLRTGEIISFNPPGDSFPVVLDTNTPYSWYVTAYNKTTPEGVKSSVWKFYTSGKGVTNYAPFPAELISPTMGAEVEAGANRIRLEWEGNDVDGESLKYDLYFGEDAEFSSVFRAGITNSYFEAEVAPGKSYYWKVVSRDPVGNTSESDSGSFTTRKSDAASEGSSAKKITSFRITHEGVVYSGVVNEQTKTIHLELGNFDYSRLTPVIETSTAATVTPASGVKQNFLDNLYYKVTAEDGTETVYDVIVLSGQHEILNFEVQHNGHRYIGIVDHENATVTIELGGNNFSSLQPIIRVSDNARINLASGIRQNFNREISYTVTSEKGTTKVYRVIAPLQLKQVFPFFGSGGYEFTEETQNERFIMFAGADLNFQIANVPAPANLIIELVSNTGSYPLEILKYEYFHHEYMEVSNTAHLYNTIIPYSIPSGIYKYRLRDGIKNTLHEHKIEIINDETTIKIESLNAEEFGMGDTMIATGKNLTRNFTVYSNFSNYMFSDYNTETVLSEDRKQLRLYFSQNVYGHFSTGAIIKPMAMFTHIDGYEHKVISNTVYFKLKRNY